jgi:hypothetical protein
MMILVPLWSLRRNWPIRRLSRAECDLLGFEGPLVLSVRQARYLFGPWRSTKRYVVVRHPDYVVMDCTESELLRLGVKPVVDDADEAKEPKDVPAAGGDSR